MGLYSSQQASEPECSGPTNTSFVCLPIPSLVMVLIVVCAHIL